MHDRPRTPLAPARAGLALCLLALGATAQELRESDHKKLGGLVERFLEKRNNIKEAEKLRADLAEELEKAGKKKAGKDGDGLQAALAMVADLEAIAFRATSYKNLRGGKPELRRITRGGGSVEYTLLLPATYKPADGPYPLVLIAPDLKEGKLVTGEQYLQEFWLEAGVRDGLVLAVVHMPADAAIWDKLFIDDGSGQRAPGGLSHLMSTYADVLLNVAVDPARVYVAGRGRGVAAAMALGATFPQNFAGVIGQAGDPGKVTWQNFHNLPVLLQGGGAEATAFAESVKATGQDNATLEAEVKNEALQPWIQAHPRRSNPTKVVLVPGSPIPTKAYWLSVPPTAVEEGTSVQAEIDRAANKITVTGKGVRSVTLFFNDVLVDMSKPIHVSLNGQTQELVVPRNLDDYLDLLYRGTSDCARIYVASRTFDLPE